MVKLPHVVLVVPPRPYLESWSMVNLNPLVSTVSPPVRAVATPQIEAFPMSLNVALFDRTYAVMSVFIRRGFGDILSSEQEASRGVA